MVRGAVKAQAASASQARCTCSMQGLNEQNTPSGRRHASADLATCTTSACASASQKHIRMQSLALKALARGHHQDAGTGAGRCLAAVSERGDASMWDRRHVRRRGPQGASGRF